jgi:hypothetical protein
VNHDRAASSHSTPDAVDIVIASARVAPPNETLLSDPIGAEVGPWPPIQALPGGQSSENGAIDGLPGRYERQAGEDAAAGLDMTLAPLGASNG